MLALPDDAETRRPKLVLNESNFGFFPMVNDQSRLQRRFYEEAAPLEAARAAAGKPLDADEALALGLVTAGARRHRLGRRDPHGHRGACRHVARRADRPGSQPALRQQGEHVATRIFGRLTAWQNWIFNRPNAVGDKGALKVYGTGEQGRLRPEPRLIHPPATEPSKEARR